MPVSEVADHEQGLAPANLAEQVEESSGRKTGSAHGRSMWTAEEDRLIEEGVRRFGCKWRQIATALPGAWDTDPNPSPNSSPSPSPSPHLSPSPSP